ncbi:NAD(P)-dependent oxidoreductase [Phyllobacterium zundukense]|uniref:NAD(P)-binding domain-containing protein n=1 Tax=Phyllobacterium zundukense TaxID=1867719 RepID=A0ACD4CVF3_9HYPH|nr:NAD(P)-dependent oxidoreductase [Phyllobacterium zundukense]UXN57578.1 NAD(P)-binding domain-containing protein [Phyllobacterium zundukense]
MKVLCLWHATYSELAQIRSSLPEKTEVIAPRGEYFSRFEASFSDVAPHAIDADVFIGFALPKGILEIAEKLKFFCWLHSGCDDLDHIGALSQFRQGGVKLANIRGANAVAVAEQAMMFVLALAKKAVFKHQVAQEGRRLFPLYADEYRSAMLSGRTIGIIGIGSIGSRIARHAKGFDMTVLGVRRNKDQPVEHVDSMYGIDELHSVLAKCDYVVLAAPSTNETAQFFGRPEIAAMKRTAFLINVSRGSLVQEQALHEALTSGLLRGYGADVWHRYEYGRSFPMGFLPRLEVHKHPNVICSNDQAANADDVLERNIQWGTQSVCDYIEGKPISREVNLKLGY